MSNTVDVTLGGMPDFGDAPALRAKAAEIRTQTALIEANAAKTQTVWNSLREHYDAPETNELIASFKPAITDTKTIAADGSKCAEALEAFANQIDELNQTKQQLQGEIDSLQNTVNGIDTGNFFTGHKDWRDVNPDAAMQESDLQARVELLGIAWDSAQTDCADAIAPLFKSVKPHPGYNTPTIDTRDVPAATGPVSPHVPPKPKAWYEKLGDEALNVVEHPLQTIASVSATALHDTTATLEAVGKGMDAINKELSDPGKLLHDAKELTKGFYEGGKQFVSGIEDMTGLHGIGKMKATLGGMAMLGKSAVTSINPWASSADRHKAQELMRNVGKQLVHLDDWRKDPAKALGETLFDITSLAGGGAASAGIKGAAEAARVVRVAEDAADASRAARAASAVNSVIDKVAASTPAQALANLGKGVSGAVGKVTDGAAALADRTGIPRAIGKVTHTITESRPVQAVTHSMPARAVRSVHSGVRGVQTSLTDAGERAGRSLTNKVLGQSAHHSVAHEAEAGAAGAAANEVRSASRASAHEGTGTHEPRARRPEDATSHGDRTSTRSTRETTPASGASRSSAAAHDEAASREVNARHTGGRTTAERDAVPARQPGSHEGSLAGHENSARNASATEAAASPRASVHTEPHGAARETATGSTRTPQEAPESETRERPSVTSGPSGDPEPGATRPVDAHAESNAHAAAPRADADHHTTEPRAAGSRAEVGTTHEQGASDAKVTDAKVTDDVKASGVEAGATAHTAQPHEADVAPGRAATPTHDETVPERQPAAEPTAHDAATPDTHRHESVDATARADAPHIHGHEAEAHPAGSHDAQEQGAASHTETDHSTHDADAHHGDAPHHDNAVVDGHLDEHGHPASPDTEPHPTPEATASDLAPVNHDERLLSDSDLRAAHENSAPTAAGRAYHIDDPDALVAAERLRPIEGHHVVDIHSENGHLIINGQRGTAADLAAMIKHDPAWHPGQPVVLMSCDTGGPESVAAAVAKHLDTTVTAPDHLAWSSPHDGHIWSASQDPHTGSTTWPPDGMFLDHHPDGTTTPSALNDHDTIHPAAPGSDAAVDHPLPDDPHGHGQAPEDAIHRGRPRPAHGAIDNAGDAPVPISYPSGYEHLQLRPSNLDGHIETRQLDGGGIYQTEMTRTDAPLYTTGMIHNSDIVFNRSDPHLSRLDGYDRSWFNHQDMDMALARDAHPKRMAAGHLVSVQGAGSAYDRILADSFDLRDVLNGRFSDTTDLLEKIRSIMESNPRHTKNSLPWDAQMMRKNLSPAEIDRIEELINAERKSNFIPQLSSVNSGIYRSQFESPIFTKVEGSDPWRRFEIEIKYDNHERIPSELLARYEVIEKNPDGSLEVTSFPWENYPNEPARWDQHRQGHGR